MNGDGVRPERHSVLAAVALTLLLWASAFVAVRYVGRTLSPGALALGRLLVGTIALGAVMVARSERLPRGRALVFSAVCGLLWFGLYNVALNAAEQRIDAGTAALLVNTGPIFIALLAGVVLGEGFPRNLLAGCAVAFGGVAVIAFGVSDHGLRATWGAAMCLLAALAYAGGVVAQKPALRDCSALGVTWLACTVGAVACLPYAGDLYREIPAAGASATLWTVYLGVGPTAVGFLCWAYALSRTDAGRLGSTTYLVPPLVVLIAWIAVGETLPPLALPGGIVCLLGVAKARRRAPLSWQMARRACAAGGIVPPPAAGYGLRTSGPQVEVEDRGAQCLKGLSDRRDGDPEHDLADALAVAHEVDPKLRDHDVERVYADQQSQDPQEVAMGQRSAAPEGTRPVGPLQ
jgi:drug/metabolite transporter (DMT)-like permease